MAVAVVQSGNYDLQIDTGFQVNAFTLDDSTRGVLNNTEYVLDGVGEFASVLDGALNVHVRRGRRDHWRHFRRWHHDLYPRRHVGRWRVQSV
jgi:hypothetical protein